MSNRRFSRQSRAAPADPRLGRMLLLSLGVHLLVAAALLLAGHDRFRRDLRPVYRVDLVAPPVASPQAGRPDASPAPAAPAKPAKPAPIKTSRPEAAKPEKAANKKPSVVKTPVASAQPKENKAAEEKALAETLRKMQEKSALEQTLAAMRQKTAGRGAAPAAPVGMPEGKGTEAGSSYELWLGASIKEQWSYSPYSGGGRTDLEALFVLRFDAAGRFVDYRIKTSSGNRPFDESIVRALLKLFKDQGLPNPPKRATEYEVAFNLKDLKR